MKDAKVAGMLEEGETADGSFVVKLFSDEEPVEYEIEEPVYEQEGRNLVKDIAKDKAGKEWLKDFSDEIRKRFEADWESSEGHRESFARDWRLFTGELPVKDVPFKGCANVNVPIMMENTTRVAFRATGELFGDWSNTFAYTSADPETEDITVAMSRHGNWQLRTGISDFKRQMHRASLLFFVAGDVSCHSYFDEVSRQNKHEILLPDEFVVPYNFVTTEPDYSDLPWYTRVLHWYPHQLETKAEDWFDVEEVLKRKPPSWDEEPESEILRSISEGAGIEEPEGLDSAPYKLLHHEGWYKLPGQKKRRWIQTIIDTTTKAVLCLRIHEKADWRDVTRFEHQESELKEYEELLAQHEQTVTEISGQLAQNSAQLGDLSMTDPARAEQMSQQMPELQFPDAPVPPTWTLDGSTVPKAIKRVPVRMFSHGVLIEPLRGSVGISYGRMQADFARAANLAFNQFSDQAHLSNIKSFIGSMEADFEEKFEVAPGKINKLKNVSAQDLNKVLVPIEMGAANPQLIEVVRMISEMAESSMQAPSVLSGEAGKSGETYRGHASRVEQASKQLTVATSKLADFVTQILRNNAILNSMFMEEEEMFAISDKWGTGKVPIRREWYTRGYSIEIRSDLKYSSDTERAGQAAELLMLPQQVPQLASNIPFMYASLKKALETKGMHEMVRFLGPAPMPPTTTLGVPEPQPAPPGQPPGQPEQPPVPEGPPQQ